MTHTNTYIYLLKVNISIQHSCSFYDSDVLFPLITELFYSFLFCLLSNKNLSIDYTGLSIRTVI